MSSSVFVEQPDGYALLRRVVDSITAMLAYWDADLRCRFANRAYELWFGVSPESLIGKHIRELLGPLYALNLPYIEGALRGEPQEFEREIPDPAGGPSRHSLASYIPDVVDGVVRGFFVIVTDISQLKRAELALRESEAKFSGMIEISADGIVGIDEEHRITIFNRGAEAIFGYSAAEILGQPLDVLIPERLRAMHREHIARFAAGEATTQQMRERHQVIVGVRKNGEEFPAEGAIAKVVTGGKQLLTVSLRDVTDRMRVETEHRILAGAGAVLSSSLKYDETLETITHLLVREMADVCIVDMKADGDTVQRLPVAYADPALAAACERLAGLEISTRNTIARSALETRAPALYEDITPEFVERATSNPEHVRLLHEIGPRSAVVAPLLSTNDVLGAIILVSRKPHRYTAADLPLVTELARRAALAIENARLYEAARRATQARDDVLGIVAHDVRNPLSSIRLAAKALDRQWSSKGREPIAIIQRSVDRANRLIEDLLDTTRIEAGALSVAHDVLETTPILLDAAEAHRLLAASASVELCLDLEGDLPRVRGDRDRLLQVFENLLGNALKFTPEGGRITIGATAATGEVSFWVSNTGPGIPPENLPHVFDRFWQARAERRGAGLGLPICKGIIEAHGGRMWVESDPNHLTTFHFTVPIAQGVASETARAGT